MIYFVFLTQTCSITLGRHSCLFCNITSQGMSNPINDNIELRPLKTLDLSLAKFYNHGADPKSAKLCENVIDQRLFNVPLDQVLCFYSLLTLF